MKNILQYLELTAEKNKGKIAIIEEEKKISFDELLISSKKAGSLLCKYIKPQDSVGVFMEKGIDSLISFFRNSVCWRFLCLFKSRFASIKITKNNKNCKY